MTKASSIKEGFREFRVFKKVRESEIISSFYLQPCDGLSLRTFLPGQFLTFLFEHPETGEPLSRTYSISSSATAIDYYRISIKREPAPASNVDLPPGIASNFLHDEIDVGATLIVREPSGHFYLNDKSDRPVVLLSGGVGLTPLVSMAHSLAAEGQRQTWFIHACENGSVHALGNEVKQLVSTSPNLHSHFCYRQPIGTDVPGQDYDSQGFITRELLQQLLAIDNYEFYMCGPPAFMEAQFEILLGLGVREDHISYEFFGPATVLRRSKAEPEKGSQTVQPITVSETDSSLGELPLVTFAKSNLSGQWNPEHESLLEFAEAQGLSPAFSCRAGICNTCLCEVLAGTVTYQDEPLDKPEPGTALICCSKPATDIILDI